MIADWSGPRIQKICTEDIGIRIRYYCVYVRVAGHRGGNEARSSWGIALIMGRGRGTKSSKSAQPESA